MIILIGILCISAGVLMNEWFLAAVLSSDGIIDGSHRIVIWTVDLFLIIWGMMTIKYRKSLTGKNVFIFAGILLILTGFLVNERVLSVLMGMHMSSDNKMFIRITELYIIIAGIMAVLYRKRLRMSSIVLFCISSMICFMIFLCYDIYRGYSIFDNSGKLGIEHIINNVHVKDRYLGWKPKANSIGRHIHRDYNVTYEMDSNGFKKIDNSKKPDFSIYFFGDSFTFGVGVQNKDTFPNIIKDKYLSKEVNVYNAGVMGYGITHMFKRFLNSEALISPGDLVIFTPISQDINRQINHPAAAFYINYFNNVVESDTYPVYDKGVIRVKDFKKESLFSKKIKSAPFYSSLYRNGMESSL
jgi:hypothetical protein